MAVSLSLLAGAGWQFFDDNGNPLSGGLLYTYEAGTTTPVTTYTSSAGTTANSNPVVLDAAGRVPEQIWLNTAYTYKFLLRTSTGVSIWSKDNIPATSTITTISSALVEFVQAGTGAQVRTVQSKLRDVVSVRDFGAVGDGVADDTAAIQAALTAIVANGGGALHVPDTSSFYKITATINIPATANSVNVIGDGIWRSEIKLVSAAATTLFTTAGEVRFKDISITATPASGNVFRANDIGFNCSGPLLLESVSLYGWDKGVRWTDGYYYKFTDCDMRLMNVALSNFTANNVMVDKCKISAINQFADISSGAGPFVVQSSSIEEWTGSAIGTSSGASPQVVLRDNYIENYPETAVAPGLTGSYYNNGFVVVCNGDIVLDSNFISCKGIRRVVDTGGSARTVKTRNNRILYQASASTTDYIYNVGTLDTFVVNDYATSGLPAGTGAYSTVAWSGFTLGYPESCNVINPISLLDETPEPAWQAITLSNGWANQDATNYQVASYKKIGKRVWLRGYISGGSATNATICTLPAGYRPTTKIYRGLSSATEAGTPAAVTMRIASTGALIMSNSPYTIGSVYLDGLSFDID